MSDHQYFTVESTALTIPVRGALAIYCGDAPTKNPDGSTSLSLRAPMLLIPPDLFKDTGEIAEEVAKVLNENAHRFFPSPSQPATSPEPAPTPAGGLRPRHPVTKGIE